MAEPFTLVEKIAQGGFGEVWRGTDSKRNETVAVKFLRLDRAGPGFLDLFKREFEILSEIRHVHLARVFDFGFDPERNLYYFTQEFCPGLSLKKAVEQNREDFEEMLVQVLSALDYIHSQGIIHFDIKPDNIIVIPQEEGPCVKLVDFGIAARLNALSGGRGGTLAYMAPELFQKEAAIDHRIDLYALGMTCLEILAGGYPFEMFDAEDVINWHQKGSVPQEVWDRAGLPRYLREILEKMLSKKPSERFSSAKVVLNFLNLSTGRKYLKEEEGLLGQIPTEGPLVERREEVIVPLLAALKTSPVVTVSGEKGMGKSRVLDEVRYALELKELPICRIEGDWELPAWPKLSSWLGLAPLPESELTDAWRITRRIDAVLEASRNRPFCLLVDEAQKADVEMKGLLKALAQRAGQGGLPGLTVVMATEDVADSPEDSPFRLKRISEQGVAQYVRLVLGDAADAQASIAVKRLAGLLYAYSGGLPLLMVEGLKFLAPHFARGESIENLRPPPEVGALYKPALESLSPSERDVVHVAAVVFRPVTEDELTVILERPSVDVLHDAANCARKGLLADGFGGGTPLRVSSQALSLGIIRALSAEDCASFHKRIARGLQSLPSSSDREIAYHLAKSGETGQAARYYKEAAKAFKALGQISAATDSLVRAIQCVGEYSEAGEELILEAARSLILSGEYSEAAMYLKKLENRPSIERDELTGWLAFKRRQFAEAREYYARALQALPAGEMFRRIFLENSLANIDLQESHPFEASVRFRKTRDWEAKLDPADRARVTNNNLGLALSLMGELAPAEEFYNERLKKFSGKNPSEELSSLSGLGYVLLQSSRYEEAVTCLTRAVDIAERTGTFHSLFSCAGNLVTALLKEGRYAESLSYLQKTATYQQRLGTLRDVAFNLLRQGDVYLTLGMGEAAHEAFQRGQKAALESGQPTLVAWFLLMEGYWQREFGEADTARQLFLQTELEAAKISQEDLVTWAVFALADLACDAGDLEECQRHLERIVPIKGDLEFASRMELLELKTHPTIKNRDARYEALEKTCREGHLNEILWELYEAWGKVEKADGRLSLALQRFEQGVAAVESVAASLPEEYRDRYIHCGGRRRLQDACRELEGHTRASLGAKIKHFFHFH